MILSLTPGHFPDYDLIDCGNFLKLERFGNVTTIRPEPQAAWDAGLPLTEWEKRAHVKFVPKSSSSGDWKKLKNSPDQWQIKYQITNNKLQNPNSNEPSIVFRLGLTSFKHVGIFPEQAVNWDYI